MVRARLDLNGEIEISTPAGKARLSGRRSHLVIDLPGWQVLRQLTRILPLRGRRPRPRALGAIHQVLGSSGLVLVVRMRRHEIAVLEPERSAGPLSRLLGFAPLRLRPRALLAASLGRSA